jgi:Tfp pilus assembly protein PilN
MRAVNLLPEKNRPRQATGTSGNGSYVLLGALALAVAGVLMYVVTLNSINSAKTDIAEAQAATATANAQASELGAYGDFAKVKAQRVAEVKGLAQSRTDWERLVRELAHVLPEGVWVNNAAAAGAGASADASAAAPVDPAAAAAATGPTLTLQGCARDQATVAEMLVRLRQMQGASDVKLDHSTRPEDAVVQTDSATASGECGVMDGQPTYDFQVAVSFEQSTGDTKDSGEVPARLGGGQ